MQPFTGNGAEFYPQSPWNFPARVWMHWHCREGSPGDTQAPGVRVGSVSPENCGMAEKATGGPVWEMSVSGQKFWEVFSSSAHTHDVLSLPLLSDILILSSALQEDFVLDGSCSSLFVFVFNEWMSVICFCQRCQIKEGRRTALSLGSYIPQMHKLPCATFTFPTTKVLVFKYKATI